MSRAYIRYALWLDSTGVLKEVNGVLKRAAKARALEEAVEEVIQTPHMIQVNYIQMTSIIVAWVSCVSKIYEVKNYGL